MKLYGAKEAPNPRRVTIYLAEKGLAIERVDFAPPYRETKTPDFLAKNPAGKIPVLELDDGTCIAESAAIVEYLEELHPEPPMIGTTAVERAQVRALDAPRTRDPERPVQQPPPPGQQSIETIEAVKGALASSRR